MNKQTTGIHHITAFAKNPQQNIDFYVGVLGLRLVKKTINFDAPEVYHFYFGNEQGSPGTIMTFFPWPTARRGKIGGGQVGTTSFVVPPGSLSFWEERLGRFNVEVRKSMRFGETYLQFNDHEGLQLELVEREAGEDSKWSFGGVPADKAIKGFGGAVLFSTVPDRTMKTLADVMGLQKVAEEGDLVRFQAAGDLGNVIDINARPMPWGADGAGVVHHIAWRAQDFDDHEAWRTHLLASGFRPTPIIDRQYFHAIYFREEGGILFEIATDPPGFLVDEEFDRLGEKLMLPEWFEANRGQIEAGLLPIEVRVLEEDRQ
ncbi:VOC family protein [Brevibacillus fulvus]|uniref:Glyoxalase family protein n=1 Tax=Brevibacillus fulvus TaxID=1125967 RepID=A0A939BSZ7_9BACL|nr:glyoxalase family protein [Brevibacillus fulvus]